MLPRLLGFLLFLAISIYRATLRMKIVGEEHRQAIRAKGKKPLHAIWHQRMVGGILAHRGEGYVTMASKSEAINSSGGTPIFCRPLMSVSAKTPHLPATGCSFMPL